MAKETDDRDALPKRLFWGLAKMFLVALMLYATILLGAFFSIFLL